MQATLFLSSGQVTSRVERVGIAVRRHFEGRIDKEVEIDDFEACIYQHQVVRGHLSSVTDRNEPVKSLRSWKKYSGKSFARWDPSTQAMKGLYFRFESISDPALEREHTGLAPTAALTP